MAVAAIKDFPILSPILSALIVKPIATHSSSSGHNNNSDDSQRLALAPRSSSCDGTDEDEKSIEGGFATTYSAEDAYDCPVCVSSLLCQHYQVKCACAEWGSAACTEHPPPTKERSQCNLCSFLHEDEDDISNQKHELGFIVCKNCYDLEYCADHCALCNEAPSDVALMKTCSSHDASHSLCHACIERICAEHDKILNCNSPWDCFLCDPSPIADLIAASNSFLADHSNTFLPEDEEEEEEEEEEQEQEKQPTEAMSKRDAKFKQLLKDVDVCETALDNYDALGEEWWLAKKVEVEAELKSRDPPLASESIEAELLEDIVILRKLKLKNYNTNKKFLDRLLDILADEFPDEFECITKRTVVKNMKPSSEYLKISEDEFLKTRTILEKDAQAAALPKFWVRPVVTDEEYFRANTVEVLALIADDEFVFDWRIKQNVPYAEASKSEAAFYAMNAVVPVDRTPRVKPHHSAPRAVAMSAASTAPPNVFKTVKRIIPVVIATNGTRELPHDSSAADHLAVKCIACRDKIKGNQHRHPRGTEMGDFSVCQDCFVELKDKKLTEESCLICCEIPCSEYGE